MRRGFALLRKGKIYIQGYAQSVAGVWIANGQVFVVASEDTPFEIDKKIKAALENSITGVPHPSPDQWKLVQTPMLEAAGVKSWATLAKGAKAVGFEENHELIFLTPSANYGNHGGKDLPEKMIRSKKNENELGEALLRAFSVCELGIP